MLPRTTPEQRADIYEDIESLLIPGFLSQPARMGSSSISLRSLMPSDIFILQHRAGLHADDRTWKIWCVASCIWMLDGQLCLGDHQAPYHLYGFLKRIPLPSLDMLFHIVTGLQSRLRAATDGVEAFCYESQGRNLWTQVGKRSPMQDSTTGLPGAEMLGTNHVQRMWLTYNLYEDDRLQEQSLWQMAKMVVSAQSPKGVEKLDKRDRQLNDQEMERRQKVMDTNFYRKIGVLKGERSVQEQLETGEMVMGMQVTGPKTEDELAHEMKKWVAGEKDWHDDVVDGYKAQILERQRAAEEQKQQQALAAQREAEQRGDDAMPYQLVGYTAEQLQILMRSNKPIKPGVRTLHDDQTGRRQHLTDKYLDNAPTSGVLHVEGDAVIGDANVPNLNAQIGDRRVAMTTEDSEE